MLFSGAGSIRLSAVGQILKLSYEVSDFTAQLDPEVKGLGYLSYGFLHAGKKKLQLKNKLGALKERLEKKKERFLKKNKGETVS